MSDLRFAIMYSDAVWFHSFLKVFRMSKHNTVYDVYLYI